MRYLVALIVAGVVTFMLFLGMQALITGGEGAVSYTHLTLPTICSV